MPSINTMLDDTAHAGRYHVAEFTRSTLMPDGQAFFAFSALILSEAVSALLNVVANARSLD
jgi:hypothetical protein